MNQVRALFFTVSKLVDRERVQLLFKALTKALETKHFEERHARELLDSFTVVEHVLDDFVN